VVLEKAIEQAVNRWAKSKGCITRKMNGLGNRSWPDTMYIFLDGRIAFIEFKAPGKRPTELQEAMIKELQKRGVYADWFDNKQEALLFLSQFIEVEAQHV
jgi:hypothetical protein